MTATYYFVLISFLIQASLCQVFTFPNGIQVESSSDNNNNLSVNWTSHGHIVLTKSDMIVFEPRVVLQEVLEVCSIDLRTCAANYQSPVTSDKCFCVRQSDEEYWVYFRGQSSNSNGAILQAVVPSRFLFSPLASSFQIGELPCAIETDSIKPKEAVNTLEELQKAFEEQQNVLTETRKELSVSEKKRLNLLEEIKNASLTSNTPQTCADVKDSNPRPVVILQSGLEVVCDTVTDNGGWIIIQRRISGDLDFYRGWFDYKYGFGDVYGNMWFGLEKVYRLTFQRRYELRVDFTYNETNYFANYKNFSLLGESELYRIQISGYSGNAGDSLGGHNNYPFSTKDRENDSHKTANCAKYHIGAWWYWHCHTSNLNGKWGSKEYATGLTWLSATGYHDTATFTEMKIRPLTP